MWKTAWEFIYYILAIINLIYKKRIHHLMVICVVWNLVDCRNTKDYNTQVLIKIKRKLNHRDTQEYNRWDVTDILVYIDKKLNRHNHHESLQFVIKSANEKATPSPCVTSSCHPSPPLMFLERHRKSIRYRSGSTWFSIVLF